MALSDSDGTSTCPCKWSDDLRFAGTDAAECERFIGAVRKHAYLHGKQRDNAWITDLVASCLSGEALKWHVRLPPQVAWSWGTLQLALVERFAPDSEKISNESTTPSTSLITQQYTTLTGTRVSVCEAARYGVIQIQVQGDASPSTAYIAKDINGVGRLYVTNDILEALRVRFTPSRYPCELEIAPPNVNGCPVSGQLNVLGVTRPAHVPSEDLCADERFYITRTDYASASRPNQPTSWTGSSTSTRSAVWRISDSGQIIVSWSGVELASMIGYTSSKRETDPSGIRQKPIITLAVDDSVFLGRYRGGTFNYLKSDMCFKALDNVYDQFPTTEEFFSYT